MIQANLQKAIYQSQSAFCRKTGFQLSGLKTTEFLPACILSLMFSSSKSAHIALISLASTLVDHLLRFLEGDSIHLG